jgi:hypothetical protein
MTKMLEQGEKVLRGELAGGPQRAFIPHAT